MVSTISSIYCCLFFCVWIIIASAIILPFSWKEEVTICKNCDIWVITPRAFLEQSWNGWQYMDNSWELYIYVYMELLQSTYSHCSNRSLEQFSGTCGQLKLSLKVHNTELCRKSFQHNRARSWNLLPDLTIPGQLPNALLLIFPNSMTSVTWLHILKKCDKWNLEPIVKHPIS